MSPSNKPEDFSDSDQRWLDALMAPKKSGAAQSTQLDAPAQEAALLREALEYEQALLERSAAFQTLNDPVLSEQKLKALLAELRRQGLLQTEVAAPPRKRPWWHWGAPMAFAVAAFAGFAVLRPLLAPPTTAMFNEPPVWRGEQSVLVRQVPEPLAEVQAVQARLKEAGVWSAIYQQGQYYVLDVDVDAAQLQEVGSVLKAEGLPLKAGLVRMRFVRR
jgi:hypothetical protein